MIQFAGRRAEHEEMLARHGYGVLVLEPRGRQDSEGDPPFVWNGEPDLRAGVRWLQARPDVEDGRIGGIGFSHGGLLMIQTAARETAALRLRLVSCERSATCSYTTDRKTNPVSVFDDLR